MKLTGTQKTENGIYLFFIVCVLVFCIGTTVISFGQSDAIISTIENRSLKLFKVPTKNALLSGEWFEEFESYCKEQIIDRDRWIHNYYSILDLCQMKERNGYVLGEDAFVMQVNNNRETMQNGVETYAQKRVGYMEDIKRSVETYGGQVIYLNVPHKTELYSEKYPFLYDNLEDIYAERRQNIVSAASEKGIACVETYDLLQQHKDEYIYYATDHHYTIRGAYYVYSALLETIDKSNPNTLSFPAWNDLEVATNNSRMVGSYLKKLGDSGRIDVDYMQYAIPKDMPYYERWDNGTKTDAQLYSLNINAYGSFMEGDKKNTVIKTYREDLPSVLYIGFSYTNPLEMFSVYNFNEVHSIDPRYWSGNICDYIEETKIDYVVIVRDDLYEGNNNIRCTVG